MHGRRAPSRLGRRLLTGLPTLAGLLAPPPAARAESAGAAVEIPRRAVGAFVIGAPGEVPDVEALLSSGPLSAFEWHTARPPRLDAEALLEAGPGGRLRCFVDLSSPRGVDVFVSDSRAERFSVRSVARSADGRLDRDEISAAIEYGLREILTGDSAFTRDEMRAWLASDDGAHRAAKSAPPAETPFPLRTAGYYWMSLHSAHVPVTHGLGVAAALVDFASERQGAAFLSAAFGFPEHGEGSGQDLVLTSMALRVGAESTAPLGSLVRVGGRLALGADLERLAPGPRSSASYPGQSDLTSSFVVALGAIGSVRLGRDATLFAELALAIDPFRVDYDAPGAGSRYRLRPGGAVGVRMW